MKIKYGLLVLSFLLGVASTVNANDRSKCIKACDSATCTKSSASMCTKEKQDCRNQCPR